MKKHLILKSSLLFALGATATVAHANIPESSIVSSKLLKVIEAETPVYPRYADRNGKEGYAVLEFVVAPDGTVAEPRISDSSADYFGKAALEAIEAWQFEPVVEEGVPVPVRTNLKFTFVPKTK